MDRNLEIVKQNIEQLLEDIECCPKSQNIRQKYMVRINQITDTRPDLDIGILNNILEYKQRYNLK